MKITGITFTNGHTIVAKIISLFTKGGPSHVVLNIDMGWGELIFHSTHGGVRIDNPTVWQKSSGHKILTHYRLRHQVDEKAVLRTMKHLGEPYGTVELLGHGVARLLRLVTFGKYGHKNPWPRNLVCSELVYEALKSDYLCIAKYNRDLISPQDLLDEMRAHPSDFSLDSTYQFPELSE